MTDEIERQKLDRLVERLKMKMPDSLARAIGWLVGPSAILIRLPLGLSVHRRRYFLVPAVARHLDAAARRAADRSGCAVGAPLGHSHVAEDRSALAALARAAQAHGLSIGRSFKRGR